MKIILQPEARNISNVELARNQQDLIELIGKVRRFGIKLPKKVIRVKSSP